MKYAPAQGLSIEYWRANDKLTVWMWWILFSGLAERSTPAAPQSNSSCLEINHFRETIIGSSPVDCTFAVQNVNFLIFLGQNYTNALKIILAQKI